MRNHGIAPNNIFCPIKHARKILSVHSRYERFLDYGEADNFHGKLEKIRTELAKEAGQAGQWQSDGSQNKNDTTR